MAERVKPIVLTDVGTGEKYTLEYNRDAVRFAEARGFSIIEVQKFPMMLYDLFFYAFRMHHKNVAKDKTDKLIDDGFGGVGNLPEAMVERLIDLYLQGYETMVDIDPENPRVVVDL